MSTQQQEHRKIEQLQQHSADELEHIEGREKENLEGWVPTLASDEEVREALEKAFDYRGDITVTKKDNTQVVGYLYDRYNAATLADSKVRIIKADGSGRVSIPYTEIAALAFTGRDNAAGKTFEAWVKKYWEKKAAGETNIRIDPEKLD